MATFLGIEPIDDDEIEDRWLETVHPDDRARVAADVTAAQHAGLAGSIEYRICDDQGRTRWLVDSWRCRREPGGVVAEGIVSDITTRKLAQDGWPRRSAARGSAYGELEEARVSAERASNTDPLTGLANRRSFQNSLEDARRCRPKRSRSACSCSMSTTSSARTTPMGTRRATTC